MKGVKGVKTAGNYSHFYTLIKDMPFSGDRSELKAILVSRYTAGRTGSLKEMRHYEYREMCDFMKSAIAGQNGPPFRPSEGGRLPNGGDSRREKQNDAHTWRRRVMAAIGQYLRNLGKKETIGEIKAIACRAAQYDDFNMIPVQRLQNVYYAFVNKNKDFFRVGEAISEDIEIIAGLN